MNDSSIQSDFDGRFPWPSQYVRHHAGVKQAFVDVGLRDAPLTFVLLHGNPTWSYLYRRFIERLSLKHRVIAIDHVGFGRSDKPRDPFYYTVDRHIANLAGVLDQSLERDGRVVLVIHDWGGPIGMGWAVEHAEQLAGVVVLNTFAFVKDPPIKLPWLFKWMVLGKGGWKRVTEKNVFVEFFLARSGPRRLAGRDLDPYRAPFPTPADRIGIARFPQLIPETAHPEHESWRTIASIEDALGRLRRVPALICWAAKDRAFRAPVMERWRSVFEHVDGPHVLPNAGHFLQEDAPDEIVDHIERWIASAKPV